MPHEVLQQLHHGPELDILALCLLKPDTLGHLPLPHPTLDPMRDQLQETYQPSSSCRDNPPLLLLDPGVILG